MPTNQTLFDAIVSLQEEETVELVKKSIDSSTSLDPILSDLEEGLIEIGNRFEREEYFVPELIYASEIMKKSLELLRPRFQKESAARKHKVVMGTAYGDVHDIGKDIVAALLDGTGFEVVDLGVNVEPEKFVKATEESGAKLVGISVLLTMSFDALLDTIQAIKGSDSLKGVSIMIGGAPTTELVRERVGADFYGKDAFEGVRIAKRVYGD
jgi:5-methyltetrahydrofolate--homocysteine methyltransferase